MERPKVVTLCGSTKFADVFQMANWLLTLDGVIVISIGVCKHLPPDHAGEALGPEVCDALDELHLRKIDLSDEILVLDVDGYVGESTSKEIAYALNTGKPVKYLSSSFDLLRRMAEMMSEVDPWCNSGLDRKSTREDDIPDTESLEV